MGQGAVRSQMDTRICFRVRERKDVDLVLGQGMLTAGWHAHTLNAPGKFLVSAPEHTTPKRARAYLVTDDDVARIVAATRPAGPAGRGVTRRARPRPRGAEPVPWYLRQPPQATPRRARGHPGRPRHHHARRRALARPLPLPDDGADIAELMRLTA